MAGPEHKTTDMHYPSIPTHLGVAYYLLYDVYIRCNNKQKLIQKHIPALNKLLELENPNWQIENEEHNPANEYRLMYSVDLSTNDKTELLLIATKEMIKIHRSYGQSIDGLDNTMEPLQIEQWYQLSKPKHGLPTVFSAVIAIYYREI